jgi:hypothetical protein
MEAGSTGEKGAGSLDEMSIKMKGGGAELVIQWWRKHEGGRMEQEKRPYRTEAGRIQGAGVGARKEDDLVEVGVRRFSLKDR